MKRPVFPLIIVALFLAIPSILIIRGQHAAAEPGPLGPPGPSGPAAATDPGEAPPKTLEVVATAHLDTQWRWTIQQTINEYIPATFRDNFALMEKYPDYVFSFEGAFRYMLLKEYYPEDYERLRSYVAARRWRVAGSWVDAVDTNVPSAESLVRQSLYGNGFFRKEFGKTSRDIFLPDCFGFGYALPSIATHCGLKSFSTQKLTWGSAFGVPFDIGMWEGVDGSAVIAALRPGDYVAQIRSDLSRDTTWVASVERQGQRSGLYAAYMYFGTGDTGGSPDSTSVDWLEKSIKSDGPLAVRSVGSDDVVDLVASAKDATLPRYRGELLMTRHGAGCYTSEAAMKRWNRQNELLADATERASAIAHWLGGASYPRESLRETWIRFLWHQFHDDLTGTSIPQAYEFSWNDEILCLNRFAGLLENAVEATAPALDTRVKGIPLVVFNPLAIEREDVVEATVFTGARKTADGPGPGHVPGQVRVYGPDRQEVPSQLVASLPDSVRVVFLARVPSVGYAVYDVRLTDSPGRPGDSGGRVKDPPSPGARSRARRAAQLCVTDSTLENARYLVRLAETGDVVSIFDKAANRELLAGPIQLQLLRDKPLRWPAWEIQWEDIMQPPRAIVGEPAAGSAARRIVENGPARVGIEVVRTTEAATYRTVIRLAAGAAGDRVEFDSAIDWYERETLLKAAFRFTTPSEKVTYDIGLGTIERGLNRPELYEVPGHQWADMTSDGGDYGVAVLNDSRYGWDHPDKETLRLTLLHTPGVFDNWSWVGDQHSQDNGHHELAFAVAGHGGDWREGGVVWQAARLNQPLLAFQAPQHPGFLGRSFSLVAVDTPAPSRKKERSPAAAAPPFVNAVKLAEESDEMVIRVRETTGRPLDRCEIRFARPIASAREVTGAEEPGGPVALEHGVLVTSLSPYQPRAFAVTLAAPRGKAGRTLTAPVSKPLALPYDLDGVSLDTDRRDGNFDRMGNSLAGDLLPDTLVHQDIRFVLGPRNHGAANVVSCRAQTLPLPAGGYNRLYALVTAVGGPALGTFTVAGWDRLLETNLGIQDYAEPIGQWNDRLVAGTLVDEARGIAPAYINRAPVAWVGTHRHDAAGANEAYQYTYLYLVRLDLPPDSRTVTLPANPRVRLLAATAVKTMNDGIRLAQPLYDVAGATLVKIHPARKTFIDSTEVRLSSPQPGARIRYTLDGSEPREDSPLYVDPVTVRSTTTLKSRAFLAGTEDTHVTALTVTRQIPREPVKIESVLPGLRCRYYEGEWSKLPGFDTLAVVREAVIDTIGIPGFARQEHCALRFDGFITVPGEGMYEFFIGSDDGSALYVADSLVLDNDGLHGPEEVSGEIALKPGLHSISVLMFQAGGDQALNVAVQGPNLPKQAVSREMLFHAGEARQRK